MHTETTFAEDLLLSTLQDPSSAPSSGLTLVAGNRSGRITLALAQAGVEVVAHAFDAHHARAIRDRLAEAGIKQEAVVECTAAVPKGPFARAYFMTTPLSMPSELVLDQLEDIRSCLELGGELIAAFEGNPDEALKTLKKVFAKVHVLNPASQSSFMAMMKEKGFKGPRAIKQLRTLALFRVVKGEKDAAARPRSFAADWPASVPGGKTLTFTSLPGCFCHRRADPGGLALAETACARLKVDEDKSKAGTKALNILDMGCGCGFVGLLVANSLGQQASPASLTLLDSHARALAAAEINARRLGIAARFVLADDGMPTEDAGRYDVFLGNPPYFGDWRIAETFVSTAKKVLRPGGVCFTVAKSEGGLKELQERIFGNVEVVHRRGYCVFISTAG